ncbi:protein translocase SEC61 complex subunit gamma [Candidatus Woesearchaeota archaeon]|nr:protein translocase SEC61 complex subunit gamma [Candidatus Woesearchaeota archaeon]
MFSNLLIRFKSFLSQSKRVLQLTKKPGREEYLMIVKVSGIGILVIGAIGFLITIISQVLIVQ